jgi:hypothetical protein
MSPCYAELHYPQNSSERPHSLCGINPGFCGGPHLTWDPAAAALGDYAATRSGPPGKMGLNVPLWLQYRGFWVLCPGKSQDLIITGYPVASTMILLFLELTFSAILFSFLFGIPLGSQQL